MKTKRSRPSYGILVLSAQSTACLQRAWEMIEAPRPAMSLTPAVIALPRFPAQREARASTFQPQVLVGIESSVPQSASPADVACR